MEQARKALDSALEVALTIPNEVDKALALVRVAEVEVKLAKVASWDEMSRGAMEACTTILTHWLQVEAEREERRKKIEADEAAWRDAHKHDGDDSPDAQVPLPFDPQTQPGIPCARCNDVGQVKVEEMGLSGWTICPACKNTPPGAPPA